MYSLSDVDRLLESESDDILAEIGILLAGDTLAIHEPRKNYIEKAKAWLRSNTDILKQQVCNDPIVSACRAYPERKRTLILAIADVISQSLTGFPVVHIAALLVLEGLDSFCGSDILL